MPSSATIVLPSGDTNKKGIFLNKEFRNLVGLHYSNLRLVLLHCTKINRVRDDTHWHPCQKINGISRHKKKSLSVVCHNKSTTLYEVLPLEEDKYCWKEANRCPKTYSGSLWHARASPGLSHPITRKIILLSSENDVL